ncbi:MAG: hypothetical protein IT461_01320 [Planctomycetes bacterium]|nr:hypothetical protein [Planctomycetota bacterium]
MRRVFIAAAVLASFISATVAQDNPAEKPKEDGKAVDPGEAPAIRTLSKKHITPELKTAVEGGLKRLSALQDASGKFADRNGGGIAIAVTALSALAFMAGGSTAEKGPYSANVANAIKYLLSCQDPNTGYITGSNDGSRIHGHGYATLLLAMAYGSQPNNKELKNALNKAVQIIQKGQTGLGGWGYIPDDLTWDEGSTTVCCLQALRAASDAGIVVEKKYIQKAIDYLYKSADVRPFTVDGVELKGYTFKYSQSSNWNPDSYALCGAAICCMNALGVYAEGATWKEHDVGKVYKGGLDWLRYKLDDFHARKRQGQGALDVGHFHYAHFYAAQAMWNAPDEVYFDEYFPKIREVLLEDQDATNKGWTSGSYGEAYSTAYTLLILQVPYQLLPLYAK